MRRLPIALTWLVVLLSACGRIWYGPSTQVSASDPDPFGGADLDDVTIDTDIGGATLRREPFGVLPMHLPHPAVAPAASAEGDDVYVAGGSTEFLTGSSCNRDMVVLDSSYSMAMMADELPVANQGFGLVRASGLLHSVMGLCGGSSDDERSVFRHLDGGDAPALVGLFPDGAYHLVSGTLPSDGTDMIIAAGGYGSGPLRDFLQVMDPRDGTARHMDVALPSARCLSAGATVGDAFYVFGGSLDVGCVPPTSSATLAMTDEIIAVTLSPDEATVVGHMPEPLAAACAVAQEDGTVLIMGGLRYVDDGAGGFRREASAAVYCFDPSTGDVSEHEDALPEGRAAMGCARTEDGRVLLFGGGSGDGTPTDEILMMNAYSPTGTVHGVIDSMAAGTRWVELRADADVPSGTAISYEVRAANDSASFAAEPTAGFVEVEDGALPATVQPGRYLEWRATLSTTDPSITPTLTRLQLVTRAL